MLGSKCNPQYIIFNMIRLKHFGSFCDEQMYLIQHIIGLGKQCSPKLGCGFVRVLLDTQSHSVDVAQVLLQQARKQSSQ